jgi:hypothetical protein
LQIAYQVLLYKTTPNHLQIQHKGDNWKTQS